MQRRANKVVIGIRRWFGNGFRSQKQVEEDEVSALEARIEERRAQGKKPLETVPKKKKGGDGEEGDEL